MSVVDVGVQAMHPAYGLGAPSGNADLALAIDEWASLSHTHCIRRPWVEWTLAALGGSVPHGHAVPGGARRQGWWGGPPPPALRRAPCSAHANTTLGTTAR